MVSGVGGRAPGGVFGGSVENLGPCYHFAMDSLTQIALGAAVGGEVAGRKLGRKALVWGGLLGLLPDLDILIPHADAVRSFTYHRSWSHSIFVMAAVTPLIVWLILRIHPSTRAYRKRWFILTFLALATHTLLDCLTVYGTQILWPMSTPPVSWSMIFIIDPAFSIPLGLGVLGAVIWGKRRPRLGWGLNGAGTAVSFLYLMWSVAAKIMVMFAAGGQLCAMGVSAPRMLTTPTAFNTLLWRIVVMRADGYLEGYYSLAADGDQPKFTFHPSTTIAPPEVGQSWATQRLAWFTDRYFAVSRRGEDVVVTDLRMGTYPDYVFEFVVGEEVDGVVQPVPPRRAVSPSFRVEQLEWVWRRIWDADVGDWPGSEGAAP